MTPSQYTRAALVTTTDLDPARLALELVSEAGEVAAVFAKAMRNQTTPDRARVVDECGDVLWGVAVLLHAVGSSLDEAMRANVQKLRARHKIDPEPEPVDPLRDAVREYLRAHAEVRRLAHERLLTAASDEAHRHAERLALDAAMTARERMAKEAEA